MRSHKFFLLLLISSHAFACGSEFVARNDREYITYHDGYAEVKDSRRAMGFIRNELVAWNYDSTFIIVKQKPYDIIMDSLRREHPLEPMFDLELLVEGSDIYHYWIIDKRRELGAYDDTTYVWNGTTFSRDIVSTYTGSVEGPFSRDDYWRRRRELGVPDSLKLLASERIRRHATPLEILRSAMFDRPRKRVVE